MIHQNLSTLRKLMLLKGATGGSKAIEATATGNPLTFVTDLARPLKSLLIPFTPVQSGTGDPSPQNIRSILPWNGLKVFGGGKNLLPESAVEYGSYNTSGEKIQDGNNKYRRLSINLPAGNYVFSTDTENCIVIRFLVDDVVIGAGGKMQKKIFSIENPANVKIAWRNDTTSEITETLHNQIELGSSVSAYEAPHITETDIVFPSPVYGGEHEAVSGKLQARQYDSTTLRWGDATNITVIGNVERRGFIVPRQVKTPEELHADPTSRFCSCATWSFDYAGDYIHYYGGGYSFYIFLPVGTDENLEFQLVVERPLPPQEQTLTGHQLTALVGNNTIWSDADGQMTAVYLKKG